MSEIKSDISEPLSLSDIFSKNLSIPPYQRPYTWGIDKYGNNQVIQLLNDIKEVYDVSNKPLILGTIILFEKRKRKKIVTNNKWRLRLATKLEIVDGQQRLTTLAIILYALGSKSIENNKFLKQDFRHKVSKENIKANQKTIKEWLTEEKVDNDKFAKTLLSAQFVVVTAPSLDDAFTFFDSQNSRGKTLADYDLLKAHHLRYIKNYELQTDCVLDWEKVDKAKKLAYLIETLLCKTRVWSREDYTNNVNIINEFKSQRFSALDIRDFYLNKYQQPPIFEKWSYEKSNGLELKMHNIDAVLGTQRIRLLSDSKKYMPFQLTQNLEGGEQFFWFIEKYHNLHLELFDSDTHQHLLYSQLYDSLSNKFGNDSRLQHVRSFFQSVILFYYDKFGTHQIDVFAFFSFHIISFFRLKNKSLTYRSINTFCKDERNLFAIIDKAASPLFTMNELSIFITKKMILKNVDVTNNGIRQEYFEHFYETENPFTKYLNQQNKNVPVIAKIQHFITNPNGQ
jgi:uncharacterized protein with ParB-like and HNH nuclease domain